MVTCKPMRWVVALVIVMCMSASDSRAAPPPPVGTLTPVAIQKLKQLRYEAIAVGDANFAKPAADAGTVHPKAKMATIKGPGFVVAVAIDTDDIEASVPDVIRLDFSGQGRFDGAPVVKLQRQPAGNLFYVKFGPKVIIVDRDGESLPVRVQGYYYKQESSRYMSLSILTVRGGTCDFGGVPRKVRLADATNNLTVNDPAHLAQKNGRTILDQVGDTLLVDLGDGSFSNKTTAKAMVGQPVLVDGRWYDVKVSDDQTRVSATPRPGPTGKLHVDHDTWWLTLIGADQYLVINGTRAPVTLPAGTYEISRGGQEIFGDHPGVIMWFNEKNEPVIVMIESGKTVTLAAGSPVQLRAKTTVRGRTVEMELQRSDQIGNAINTLVVGKNRMPPPKPPQLKVIDADGNVVHEGAFEYG